MDSYDPMTDPEPSAWLALSEFERIDQVAEYHQRAGDFGENLRLHSVLHTVVENQLALGQPVQAVEALARLRRSGLDRHAAIHAVGGVLAEHLFPILKADKNPPDFDARSYALKLMQLASEG